MPVEPGLELVGSLPESSTPKDGKVVRALADLGYAGHGLSRGTRVCGVIPDRIRHVLHLLKPVVHRFRAYGPRPCFLPNSSGTTIDGSVLLAPDVRNGDYISRGEG